MTTLRSVLRGAAVILGLGFTWSLPAHGEVAPIAEDELNALLAVKVRAVRHMALNPTVLRAVRKQNAIGMAPEEIARRDEAWRATKEVTEFKRSLLENSAGRFLRSHVERNSSVNEAFLTDGQGANVAAFPPTSDYFQGDEAKWSESFNGGNGRVWIGPVERDESTNVTAVQISAPVLHNGTTIGVLVVGVTLDYVSSRAGK